MATSFPTSLDTFVDPAATDDTVLVPHHAQHANANDAIAALEAKVGINSSTDPTSLDYKVANITTPTGANPTGSVGTSAVNGTATTFMRSDAAPALAASVIQALVPSGALIPFAGSVIPTGWLLADGSTFQSTTYPNLASALGDTWGNHSGTTYHLPDFRDRSPIGTSPGSLTGNRPTARTLGQTGGEETHTLSSSEVPSTGITTSTGLRADLQTTPPVGTGGWDGVSFIGGSDLGDQQASFAGSGNVQGGGGAHNNMQPFGVVQWLIKT